MPADSSSFNTYPTRIFTAILSSSLFKKLQSPLKAGKLYILFGHNGSIRGAQTPSGTWLGKPESCSGCAGQRVLHQEAASLREPFQPLALQTVLALSDRHTQPRGSKYPMFKDSGPNIHTLLLGPESLNTGYLDPLSKVPSASGLRL